MGMKIYGPQAPNDSTASVKNNDLVVNADGSINVATTVNVAQLASEGTTSTPVPAKAMQVGGKDPTGNLIAVKVDAEGRLETTIATATTTIASEGDDGTTAPVKTMQMGGKDAGGNLQSLLVEPNGTLHVQGQFTPSGTQTVTGDVNLGSEGAPGAAVPVEAIQIGGRDGTGLLRAVKTDNQGQVYVTGTVTTTGTTSVGGTVTSNQGNANTIANAWPVKLTDGAEVLNVNGDGSLNVNVISGITAATEANQGTAAALTGGWPVKLTDGNAVLGTSANPLQVKGDPATPVYMSGTVTANQGNGTTDLTKSWASKITDGVNTAGVNADGSVKVAVVSGSITASNSQGTPNSVGNGWPVKVTDGTNVLGTSTNPFMIQVGDGTRTAAVNASGGLNVHVLGGTLTASTQQVTQGTGGSYANAWMVKITDGTNLLGTALNPLLVQTQGTATVSGTVTVSGVNNAVSVKPDRGTGGVNSSQVTVDAAVQVLASNGVRKKLVLQNLSTQPVYVLLTADSALAVSGTVFSFILQGGTAANDGKGGTFIDDMWTGYVKAIAAAGTGNKVSVIEYA